VTPRAAQIALASCETLPEWEHDDAPFHGALRARGVELTIPAWSDDSVDWSRFDAVLLRTTWDYQTRREAFCTWAEGAAAQTRLHNPAAVIRWNTYKHYLMQLAEAGVATIPTVWLESAPTHDELRTLLDERGWSRAFLKPAVGATASHTLRFANDEQDRRKAIELATAQAPMLLQPYLSRVEQRGELSLVLFDEQPSHAIRKVPVPGDYRVQDDFGASDAPAPISAALLAASQRALDAAHRVGPLSDEPLLYARCDFLEDERGELLLTELELVEPSLFFRHHQGAAERFAEALLQRL
jgi:hypothetical protein